MMHLPEKKIFVAGHRGMVGSALLRRLKVHEPDGTVVVVRDRKELDLTQQSEVIEFFQQERIDAVIFAAAKVGGIYANSTYPADFAYQNVMMAANAIHGAYLAGVPRFLFLGSTCIYPRMCAQPIEESSLLSSPLEKTNEAYALAKIMGLKLCEYYRRQHGVLYHSAMPTNLYGPGDNYHPDHSHVIPGLMHRLHEAKENNAECVRVWGTGNPRREFLHVDDLAAALTHLIGLSDPPDWVNVGTGEDISIRELAVFIAEVVGYTGQIVQDTSKPDGTPLKRTDISRISETGWQPTIDLTDGLEETYRDYLSAIDANVLRSA